jgi:hypothetical protein
MGESQTIFNPKIIPMPREDTAFLGRAIVIFNRVAFLTGRLFTAAILSLFDTPTLL